MISFKYKHIPVEIRAGFFIVITFMLLVCDNETVMTSLCSSVLHECGHLAAIVILSENPEKIVFSASGMRIDRKRNASLSFSKEIIIAASGVLVNFLISFFSYTAYLIGKSNFLFSVFAVNMIIGAFNILPLESLDGAVCLKYYLCRRTNEEKAETVMNIISVTVSVALIVFFAFTVYFRKVNLSFAVVIIYLMILMINRILELKKSVI